MTSRILAIIAVACSFFSCFLSRKADAVTDLRLTPITKAEVKQIADTAPLRSSQHFYVLSRSYISGVPVSRFAYEQYKLRLSKKTDDAQATLLAAAATLKYYEKSSDSRPKGSQADYNPLLKEAGTLFRRAMFLDPNSALTNKHFGYFMYRYEYNQGQQIGLLSLQRSVNLNPNDPGVHCILGDIYANPFGKYYDPKKGEAELLKAIALDSTCAYPHNRVMGLYLWIKQPAKVREHLAAYRKLLPNPEKSDKYLNGILKRCAEMEEAPSVAAARAKK